LIIKKQKEIKMKTTTILAIGLMAVLSINCPKEKKDDKPLVLAGLVLLDQQAKAKVDTTPRCAYTSRGNPGILTNVAFQTASSTNQLLKFTNEDSALGVSFQTYSMIRVTTKIGGKLFFSGSPGDGIFGISIFANTESCAINANTSQNLTTVYTATGSILFTPAPTLTFTQASTYLILVSVAFGETVPSISVRYTD
jgi:hypothetical protein